MGLLDNYTGIGMSPRPKWQHQLTITRAGRWMYDELEEQGLQIASEATVTDDWDDLAPDLVIFDQQFYPLTIIEITTHRELRRIIKKCYELITRFPQSEYFVYDYEDGVLYMFDSEIGAWPSSKEYNLFSKYLERPLIKYLGK